MNNKKQIEEMEKILNDVIPYPLNCTFSFYGKTLAEALYNAGYHKVEQDYAELLHEYECVSNGLIEAMELVRKVKAKRDALEQQLAETRKETAREIFELVRKMPQKVTYNVRGIDRLTISGICTGDIYELAKQYGVEVEDNGN